MRSWLLTISCYVCYGGRRTIKIGQGIRQLSLLEPWEFIRCLFDESLMPPIAYKLFVKHILIPNFMVVRSLAAVIQILIQLTLQSSSSLIPTNMLVSIVFFNRHCCRYCFFKSA
jgi:hypothetical protein